MRFRYDTIVYFLAGVLTTAGYFYYFYVPNMHKGQIQYPRNPLLPQLKYIQRNESNKSDEQSSKNLTEESQPNVPQDNRLVTLVNRSRSEGKPVLVTVINDAYLPFAHSWLCNTMFMGIHRQVLILVTDETSKKELTRLWPRVHVEQIVGDELKGNQDYSHAGYVRIMVRRTESILELLLSGVEVFLFELDACWLKNAIPDTQKQSEGFDIVVIPVASRPGVISGGFIYMKPTEKMIALWDKLNQKMKALDLKIKNLKENEYISEGDNDQQYLSGLVRVKYGGVKVAEMPLDKYPDGLWYAKTDEVKAKTKPLVIQNNWVVGNKGKMDRAKKFKHWFWNSDTEKCDSSLVRQITKL